MASDYAASVQGACIRVTRLQASGAPATGANASYVMSSFMSVSFTPEYEEGEEITERAADGSICIQYKAPDTLKNVSIELAICDPDPELTEMLCGGTILTASGQPTQSIGYAAPLAGTNPNETGCSLEVWSYAITNGRRAATLPYWRWLFPQVNLRPSGDRVIENGALANTFEGTGNGNTLWGDGPSGDWPFTSDRPYAYARMATAPVGIRGYQAVV